MTNKKFTAMIEQTSFRKPMRIALRLYLVSGYTARRAAACVGRTPSTVHLALAGFYRKFPETRRYKTKPKKLRDQLPPLNVGENRNRFWLDY